MCLDEQLMIADADVMGWAWTDGRTHAVQVGRFGDRSGRASRWQCTAICMRAGFGIDALNGGPGILMARRNSEGCAGVHAHDARSTGALVSARDSQG